MPEEIKFTEDELGKIQEFQQNYANIQLALGQAEVTRIRLDQQSVDVDTFAEGLKEQFADTQAEERKFIEEINEKYGPGVLDPETGVFTPSDVQAQVPTDS